MEKAVTTQEKNPSHEGRTWQAGEWPTPQQVQQCAPKIHTFTEFVPNMPFTMTIMSCRMMKMKTDECMVAKVCVRPGDLPVLDEIIELWVPKSLRFKLKDQFENKKAFPFWASVIVKKDKRSFGFDIVEYTPQEITKFEWASEARKSKKADFYTSLLDKFNEELEDDDLSSLHESDSQSVNQFGKRYMTEMQPLSFKKRRF